MRMGRVKFEISYVVDLDNHEMVDHATDLAIEDVCEAYKYNNLGVYLENVEDNTLMESDIQSCLIPDEDDEDE